MSYTVDRVIDIIENNRPKPRSCVKFFCGICNKSVKDNQKAIQCDSCDLWIHIVCNDISDDNLNNVPFTRCDNSELNNINTSNSMSFLESLPNVEMSMKHHNFQMCHRMKLVWKYPQNRVQIITQLKILNF